MQNAFWQSESDSRWFLNNFFRNTLMARKTPLPSSWQMPFQISIFLPFPRMHFKMQNSNEMVIGPSD